MLDLIIIKKKKDNLAVVNKAKSCPQLWLQKQTSIAIIGAEFGLWETSVMRTGLTLAESNSAEIFCNH